MGVVVITTLVFGLITPPYGLSLLVASKYVGVGFGPRRLCASLPLYVVFFLTIAFAVYVSEGRAVAAEAGSSPNRWDASRVRPVPDTSVHPEHVRKESNR